MESVRLASEALSSIRTVASFGLQGEFIRKYEELVSVGNKRKMKEFFLPAVVSGYIASSPYGLFGSSL